MAMRDYSRQRLIDLVGDGRCQLAHTENLRQMCKLGLCLQELGTTFRNSSLQVVKSFLKRNFTFLLRRTNPACGQSAQYECCKVGFSGGANRKRMEGRYKEVFHQRCREQNSKYSGS